MTATVEKNTGYRVVFVERTLAPAANAAPKSAEPPRYIRERDEPAFIRAWEQVAELKRKGMVKPVPPRPIGGIKLRGKPAE